MSQQVSRKSPPATSFDYIMFVVSLIAFIGLLIFANEWFWLAIPTLLTYLVKIFRVI